MIPSKEGRIDHADQHPLRPAAIRTTGARPGRDRPVRERGDDAVLVAAVAAVAVASVVVVVVVVAVVAVVAVRDPRQSRHRSGSGGVRGRLSPRELRTPAFAFALASSTSSYVGMGEVRGPRDEGRIDARHIVTAGAHVRRREVDHAAGGVYHRFHQQGRRRRS